MPQILALLASRTVVTQLVALLLALLAAFHVALPDSIDQPQLVEVAILVLAAVTAVFRFGHPGSIAADAKAWYLSRTIWTQIVAALFAFLALAGKVPTGFDQLQAVSFIMGLIAVANVYLRHTTTAAIA